MMSFYHNAVAWLQVRLAGAPRRLKDEQRGDAGVITAIVLIGIAVVLGFVFKDAIGTLAGNLWRSLVGGGAEGNATFNVGDDNPFASVNN
ncbi:MAG: hypothetical protein IKM73_13850 [Acidaminococcaceae bacterium]|nr:hypothetical protein [Acidaminococcaceae bacterium]